VGVNREGSLVFRRATKENFRDGLVGPFAPATVLPQDTGRPKLVEAGPVDPRQDPSLTFSLTRTAEEEEARRAVLLPYTHARTSSVASPLADNLVALQSEADQFDDDLDGDLDI
jgi:hypothetical protein